MTADVGDWLDGVRTAALVGTARREVPPPAASLGLRVPEGRTREEHLLDAAALVDVIGRAGQPLAVGADPLAPARPDETPAAGQKAGQLLGLLLTQPPVPKAVRDDLVRVWLASALGAGVRVPDELLPLLLDHAATRPGIANALGSTLGERGRWLAGINPAWTPCLAAGSDGGLPEDWQEVWAHQPADEAISLFERARADDPQAATAVLEEHWDTVSAKVRAGCIAVVGGTVRPDDEPLLERALDDRGKSVREAAQSALDRLPDSARGRRMAARLRPLLQITGTLRRRLHVAVPEDPDDAAVRDGLRPAAAGDVETRNTWLLTILRGAPLEVFTEATGKGPEQVVTMLAEDYYTITALPGVAAKRGDARWAQALWDHGLVEIELTGLLSVEHRAHLVKQGLRGAQPDDSALTVLYHSGTPWPDGVAHEVLLALARSRDDVLFHHLPKDLPARLPPSVGSELKAVLDSLPPESRARRALGDALQIHAFHTSITEAFR